MVDWVFVIKTVIGAFLFLALTSLAVHIQIKNQGGNAGKLILKVFITQFLAALIGSLIIGLVTYLFLSALPPETVEQILGIKVIK